MLILHPHYFHSTEMVLLDCVEEHSPPSLEHDYMRTSAPKMKSFATTTTQTTLTVQDIEKLEAAASTSEPKPGEEFVAAATESDERVTFYTGIPSVSLLNGQYRYMYNVIHLWCTCDTIIYSTYQPCTYQHLLGFLKTCTGYDFFFIQLIPLYVYYDERKV